MITEFITYLRHIRGYSWNTCNSYEKDLRHFARWMRAHDKDARWSTIDRDDLDEYVTWQSQQGLTPATTNRRLSAISSLYDYLKRDGRVEHNPTRYESRRKIGERIPNTIPMEVLQKAYAMTYGSIHIMLGILINTGIRIHELLEIKKHDIDFNGKSIRIHGKGQTERIVYLPVNVMEEVKTYSQYQQANSTLFGACTQREVRHGIYNILRPLTDAKQLSPHAIRHTFATENAKNGANVTTLALMMGHKNIKTTQKYIDMTQHNINQAFTTYQQHITQ